MTIFKEIFKEEWKKKNKGAFRLLKSVWKHPGISRHELAEEFELSKVAVTNTVNNLIQEGLLEEGGSSLSARGRRPVSLRFPKSAFHSAGISFYDGKKIRISIINAQGEILAEKEVSLSNGQSDIKCDYTIKMLKEMLREQNLESSSLLGIGISITGIMDMNKGTVISSSQFELESEFHIRTHFENALGCRVWLINFTHLLTELESRYGNAKGMSSFLYFESTFAMGICINGKIWKGHQQHAGEIGFLQIADNSQPGADGRSGLLMDVHPFYKITDRIQALVAAKGNTVVRKYMKSDKDEVTAEMLIAAIKEGDLLCAELLSSHFQEISKVIVNMAYIFNPEAIFFRPWTAECKECTTDIVKRHMGHYGVHHWGLKTEILSASCGNEKLAFGAALLPADSLFEP